ncbi:MAG: hypothetical protein LBG16_05420, partial [Elusimicrobiota bacterium]|nr:hypothetical protein [Elusimicrobiota bacterium]
MFNFSNFRSVCGGVKGQITLPALLLIPTILLAIYLLFETTKLSREKIRHQFALDTSAFTELTATSNFLNNLAYSNGAYPFRLFEEYFERGKEDILLDEEVVGDDQAGKLKHEISLYDFYYAGGAFPAPPDPKGIIRPEATEWEFHYGKGTQQEAWDTENPSVNSSSYYDINSELVAKLYVVPWDIEAVQLYILLYHVLGKIYEGQRKVYDTVSS